MQKTILKTFLQHIAVILCKTRLKKQLYSKNKSTLKIFKNGHQAKAIYSICKIPTLGQKLKMQKNMLKTFLQHIAVVLCKKQPEKAANIRKMRAFSILPKMATKQRLQPLQNPDSGSKIKNAKKHAKNVLTTYWSCSMEKTARKNS